MDLKQGFIPLHRTERKKQSPRNPDKLLNTKAVRQIIEMMKQADLTEFELEEENFRLRIARGSSVVSIAANTPAPAPAAAQLAQATPAPAAAPKAAEGPCIKSPMVGTFYSSSSPETPPFVEVGSKVSTGTVVCIIEAMKVMNEIQAEVSGVIEEVLIGNGESVEYGQAMFRIKPA